MSDITTPFLNALTATLKTAAPDLTVIFRDQQVQKVNVNNLVEAFENAVSAGLQPPFGVIALGPMVTWPEFAPMGIKAFAAPADIYYVRRTLLNSTTTSTVGSGVIKTVASSSWMFNGQNLRFETAGVLGRILTVDSATQITLESAVTTSAAEKVREADAQQQLDHKASTIRDAIIAYTGGAFQNVTEDPVVDTSSGNAPNRLFLIGNMPYIGAHIAAKLLVAETYS